MKKIHPDDILGERFNALSQARRPGRALLKVQIWTHLRATKYLSLIVGRFIFPGFSRELVSLASRGVWIGRN